ncbi:Ubiquitin-like-specific protease 1A [Platanthera guangdongensis]|uniref:Ubiquitin-like-specific protease 1A n=1 Tax=Platanthera guangdongensis TaxID=2320717 RepID=A0ABR2MBY5_9ASPA
MVVPVPSAAVYSPRVARCFFTARYLVDEVKDKSTKTIDTQYWKKESVDDLPLQKNGWDCGMFMLKYADFYSRGLKLCFRQEHMAYFRKRTALEILRLRAE